MIAEREQRSERTLRHLYRDYLASADVHDYGLTAITETLDLFTAAMGELSAVAQNADNDNARIGAIRTLLSAATARIELLAALGRLPRQLGESEAQRDVIQIIDGMVRILERHKVNDEVIEELLALVE